MRIRIKLNLKNKYLPINYKTLIQGAIYNAIRYNDYSNKLHNEGKRIENRPFKLFVFSNIIGKSEYVNEGNKLFFKSEGYFEISSFDSNFINCFSNYLMNNDYITLGKEVIDIIGYDIVNENYKVLDEMIFITISPVVYYFTEYKKPLYLHPSTEEYKEGIINNLRKKYYLCYNENCPDFEISSIDDIEEVKVYFRKVFYICYNYQITFRNITPKILNIIMSTGIGTKNSMGFGMVKYEKKNIPI